MGSVNISDEEITISYPHGEKLTFLSTKSSSFVLSKEYLVFEGIYYFLEETKN